MFSYNYFYIYKLLVLATNYDHFAYTQSLSSGKRIASNHNLTGKYIMMGIGDTGLDTTHCMFYDANEEISYSSVNYNHRKIISYVALQNDKEDLRYSYLFIYLLLIVLIVMDMELMFVVLLLVLHQ